MLNHADYVITAIQFPYEAEDPWAAKVKFKHVRTGKLTEAMYGGRDGWMKVADQCRKQISSADYVRVTNEPKPKKQRAVPAPIIGKGKGKKKG